MLGFIPYAMPRHLLSMMLMAALLVLGSAPAHAATTPPSTGTTASGDPVCTDFKGQAIKAYGSGGATTGLLSDIYVFIKDIVGTATQKLFQTFTSNAGYKNAVFWSMVLAVVFFGIAFTIGVVQVSFAQVLVRLIKFGLIATLISPGGWTFFSNYAVKFFMDGTDELVKGVISIGMGTGAPPPGATPFYELDKMANFLIQPDTITQIMATTFAGGPYGLAMSGLLGIATWGFVKMLIKALRIYAVTFVARSLLLGIAPIFIIFLMFDKTKQMFISWLNALIAMSLQPILLFTFLSFFMVMIETASQDMMGAEVCWTEFSGVAGTAKNLSFWRFKDRKTGELTTSQMTWEGSLQCLMKGTTDDGKPCPEFPLNIIDILTFLILVYIAQRFMDVVDRIANELSNTFISLDAGGKIDQFMQQASSSMFKSGPKPSKPAGT